MGKVPRKKKNADIITIKPILFISFELFDFNHRTKSGSIVHVDVELVNGCRYSIVQMSVKNKKRKYVEFKIIDAQFQNKIDKNQQ